MASAWLTLMAVSGMAVSVSMILQAATGPAWWVAHGVVNTNAAPNDFAAVNQGQLKYAASPFYDRLMEVGYTNAYPWSGQPNDCALANIGQRKNVFSFDAGWWMTLTAMDRAIMKNTLPGPTALGQFRRGGGELAWISACVTRNEADFQKAGMKDVNPFDG